MNYQQKIVVGWIGGIITILVLGFVFDGISFDRKSNSKPNFIVSIQNLSGIEQIPGKIYSSPGSLDSILGLYRQSKTSLSLEIYEFTEKRFKSLFKDLLENNVNIRLIMEDKKYQQFKNTFKDIQNYLSGYNNFKIQSDKNMKTSYVHSKFALVDSGFIIQTANLTHSSFANNREYFFWSTHSGVYQSLSTIFEKDWQGKAIVPADIHPNLLVCPINCRAVLEYLIRTSQKSLIIHNQYIEDERLLSLLEERKSTLGPQNLVIHLPDIDKNKKLQQKWGKQVVKLSKKPYIHAKMMLVDNKILYLGSINFSSNSMDNNREVGILLTDPAIIEYYLRSF